MALTIQIPNTYEPERQYILSVLMTEFLDLDIQIQVVNRKNVLITRDDHHQLSIADELFNTPSEQWLQPVSLPQEPLKVWDLASTRLRVTTVEPHIPVIYGNDPGNPDFFCQSESEIYLGLDIFGSAFFMLSRYEEVVKPERDRHDRFPATASIAYQEGFLDRPIINEYLEILWACLKHLWPGLKRKPRQFQTYVSHDVDEPFKYAFAGISSLVRQCGGDLIKHRNPGQALNTISHWTQVKTGNFNSDPCNTFDMIMDISEKHNLKSSFYFITDHSAGKIDGDYSINHPLIRSLLHKIHQRGHEIGLHTSYNTYKDPVQTKREFEILKQVCTEEGIQQEYWGGRQHFLRWRTPNTFQNWENAGLDYDSTLSFADLAGFRCGICYEFSTFNINTRQPLKLRERPLMVMECTVIDKRYMNLGLDGDAALLTMDKYKQRCQIFNGDFTLLWHNSRLADPLEIRIYESLVSL
ncbi:polysaccharide deacetylase family protein [Sphaerospermopsis aphanizomenoides BCCUSP55]|nr:polysaccharide deacetylase family protein [Sphaerospermopsis aphanizomenoides BCCUSP55]